MPAGAHVVAHAWAPQFMGAIILIQHLISPKSTVEVATWYNGSILAHKGERNLIVTCFLVEYYSSNLKFERDVLTRFYT